MRGAATLASLLGCFVLAGCGYVGEPLYPTSNTPVAVNDLTAVERGDKIFIAFDIAPLTTDGLVLTKIGGVDLRVGPAPHGKFDTDQWARLARKIPIKSPDEPKRVTAEFSATPFVGQEAIIGVRVLNAKDRALGWSNLVTVHVRQPVEKPVNIQAVAVAQGVKITWSDSGAASYRIFRKTGKDEQPVLLGQPEKPEYVDATTEYGKSYQYWVQAIQGHAESVTAASKPVIPVDVFPPAVPSGLTAAAGISSVELAWERDTESDLKGYIVYRSAAGGPFEKIAEVNTPSYSDLKVESGKSYGYEVSAADQLGNESARSKPVEAKAP